jgi:hypothetical protein
MNMSLIWVSLHVSGDHSVVSGRVTNSSNFQSINQYIKEQANKERNEPLKITDNRLIELRRTMCDFLRILQRVVVFGYVNE